MEGVQSTIHEFCKADNMAELTEQFLNDEAMQRLETRCQDTFWIDNATMKRLGALKPEDALGILRAHTDVSQFIRCRHSAERRAAAAAIGRMSEAQEPEERFKPTTTMAHNMIALMAQDSSRVNMPDGVADDLEEGDNNGSPVAASSNTKLVPRAKEMVHYRLDGVELKPKWSIIRTGSNRRCLGGEFV